MRAAYVAGRPLPPCAGWLCCGGSVARVVVGLTVACVGERRWAVGAPAESVGGARCPARASTWAASRRGHTADGCRDLAVSMGARGVLVSVGTSSVSESRRRVRRGASARDLDGHFQLLASWSCLRWHGVLDVRDKLGPLGGVRAVCAGPAAERAAGPAAVHVVLAGPCWGRARETSRETAGEGGTSPRSEA